MCFCFLISPTTEGCGPPFVSLKEEARDKRRQQMISMTNSTDQSQQNLKLMVVVVRGAIWR